ncbi:MAG TPA: hypothetical protein VFA38_02270 [Nitrospirales bacterium]|nr:hypothetical protein [Nitrospirales bacterium]
MLLVRAIIAALVVFAGTPISGAASDLAAIVNSQSALLERLASDEDARRAFETLRGTLGLPSAPATRGASTDSDGAMLVAELSAWQLASAIGAAADTDPSTVAALLQQRQANIAWLVGDGRRTTLASLLDAARALGDPATDARVARLALALAATRAELQAERHARQELTRLQDADEARRAQRGQARLCGTWQWTIHNHRNHQDHKATMIFPPPENNVAGGVRLTSSIVRGDTVFLRWDFQGGFQEESLLFTGEGNRLEGTFTNSTGAWGSITGKRVNGCPRGDR